ncbi:hypothetical protein BH11MYX1_BH11MYX1_27650 [soil metagenome]
MPPEPIGVIVVMLHGAGSRGDQAVQPLEVEAARRGLILLAPQSHAETWDGIRGEAASDATAIAELLQGVIDRTAVRSIAIAGFSDGASYALGLGLGNGGIFRHVLAFSPGFVAGTERRGDPKLFISHGTHDQVLPIDRCSRRFVPALRQVYEVDYREFDGGHLVRPDLVEAALESVE